MIDLLKGLAVLAKGLFFFSETDAGMEILEEVTIFCGLGLLASFEALSNGIDLGRGFI